MNNYEIQEEFLSKLQEAYTTYSVEPVVKYLADSFHYASMWVFDEITSKDAYLCYLTGKLATMKKAGSKFNFIMMYVQGDGKPVLMFTPKTPEGDYGAFVAKTTDNGKIERLDLTAASFYQLSYKDKTEFEEFQKKAL